MISLQLIAFSSAFQGSDEVSIRRNHAELIAALESHFALRIIPEDQLAGFAKESSEGVTLVFIASGGTEGIALRHLDELPRPLVLLTDGKANSLAASMELSCRIRQMGGACRILHGEPEDIILMIEQLAAGTDAHDEVEAPRADELPMRPSHQLQGLRIGVLGEPSDWLISSAVDYAAAHERWGVEYADIPLSRVDAYYKEVSAAGEESGADAFIRNAVGMKETNREEVIKAMRLYRAIRRIVDEEHLDAVTVRCFDLIPTTGTTGCLALAMLNDEGIAAGCEGDLQSIFTMLLMKRLTEKDAFMANPARIRDREVIFAHCTIGLKQVKQYIVRSHFESGTGVAIQGLLPADETVTVVKFGGRSLDRYAACRATLKENQDDPKKCRTQILLHTEDNQLADYLLNRSIGNHHIILQGDYVAEIDTLAHSLGLQNEVTKA